MSTPKKNFFFIWPSLPFSRRYSVSMFQTTTFLKETKNTSPTFKKIKFFSKKVKSRIRGGKSKYFSKFKCATLKNTIFVKKRLLIFKKIFLKKKFSRKLYYLLYHFCTCEIVIISFFFQQSGFGNNFSILGFINFGVNFGLDFGLDFVNDPLYTWARVLRHGNIFGQ